MTLRAILTVSAAMALFGAALYGHTAKSTEPMASMGTLTCIAEPGEKDLLGPEQRVSCEFEPLSGSKASLAGMIKRVGTQVPSDVKVVLAWAVLGPVSAVASEQLEGRYVGVGGEGRGVDTIGLVGGSGGHITLRPLMLDPAVGENAAHAVLELQLIAMKA